MRLPKIFAVVLLAATCVFRTHAATVEEELARARENVRIAEATVDKIESDLEKMETNPASDPEAVAARKDYLEKVKRLRDEHRRILERMEKMAREAGMVLDAPDNLATNAVEDVNITVKDPVTLDEVELLEQELQRALGEYDGILRKSQAELAGKMQELRANASSTLNEMAQEAAEAAGKAGGGGSSGGSSGAAGGAGGGAGQGGETAGGESAEAGGQPAGQPGQEQTGGGQPGGGEAAGGTGGQPGGEAGTGADPGATAGTGGKNPPGKGGTQTRPGGGTAGGNGGQAPTARPGAEDDDIVARQLREAAEQEKDPVLKEKLWKEYDAYKKGSK